MGSKPNELINLQQKSVFKNDIYFITDLSDEHINSAYSGLNCLLFPSLYEGFVNNCEAMASQCPVITTNKAPMNEVGGKAALYRQRPN
jgi:glycosyltransferase involved in cell wall biosynthesis